jgi:hypothetical protein
VGRWTDHQSVFSVPAPKLSRTFSVVNAVRPGKPASRCGATTARSSFQVKHSGFFAPADAGFLILHEFNERSTARWTGGAGQLRPQWAQLEETIVWDPPWGATWRLGAETRNRARRATNRAGQSLELQSANRDRENEQRRITELEDQRLTDAERELRNRFANASTVEYDSLGDEAASAYVESPRPSQDYGMEGKRSTGSPANAQTLLRWSTHKLGGWTRARIS